MTFIVAQVWAVSVLIVILIVIASCSEQIDAMNSWAARRERAMSASEWSLRLLGPEGDRYRKEWGAHLAQLVAEGEVELARIHRRQFMRQAIMLAVTIRVRRARGRAQ